MNCPSDFAVITRRPLASSFSHISERVLLLNQRFFTPTLSSLIMFHVMVLVAASGFMPIANSMKYTIGPMPVQPTKSAFERLPLSRESGA